jgi:hypothetical protein
MTTGSCRPPPIGGTAQVELGVVPRQVLFGREVDLLLGAAADVAQLAEVDPLRGGEHRPHIALRSRHYECLRDVGRRETERLRMGDRALGVRVR